MEKPDIVPPSAPMIHDVETSERGVRISWHRSPTSDAAEHVLLRRRGGETEWMRMDTLFSAAVTSWSDTTLQGGVIFEYALYAYDDDGLRSPLSNIVTARRGTPARYVSAENVVGTWNAEKRAVELSWSFSGGPCVFHIYRTGSEAPARLYVTLEEGTHGFEDASPGPGRYKYAVKAVYPDGGESALKYSPEVTVP